MVEGYNMLQSCTSLRSTTITKYEIVGPKLIWVNLRVFFCLFFLNLCFPFLPLEDFCSRKNSSPMSFFLWFLACSSILIVFAWLLQYPSCFGKILTLSLPSIEFRSVSSVITGLCVDILPFLCFMCFATCVTFLSIYIYVCVCVCMCFASIPSLVCHRTITALSFAYSGSAPCWVAVALVVLVVLLLVLHLFLLFLLFLLLSFSLFFLLLFCFSCSCYSSYLCSFSCSCSCCSCSCSCSRMLFLWLCCLCQERFPRKEQKKKEPTR